MSPWQTELFEKAQAARAAEPARRPLPKYQRNRVDDLEAAELARKLAAHMTDRKPYRDSALTLQVLADAVGATPHMLSQVLNLHLRKSFFFFVNSYRTEELMPALDDRAQNHRGVPRSRAGSGVQLQVHAQQLLQAVRASPLRIPALEVSGKKPSEN